MSVSENRYQLLESDWGCGCPAACGVSCWTEWGHRRRITTTVLLVEWSVGQPNLCVAPTFCVGGCFASERIPGALGVTRDSPGSDKKGSAQKVETGTGKPEGI